MSDRRWTTRLNPTANGDLHVGHIYMALVNECLARETGGEFVVRFDDNTRYWTDRLGADKVHQIIERQLDDLEWAGLGIDAIHVQSETEERVLRFLEASRWQAVVDHFPCGAEFECEVISDPPIGGFGLTAFITAEKVVLDRWQGVTAMVRGLELLSEHALYMYYCALFGFKPPRCVYVPRLRTGNEGDEELSDVSKTVGNWKVGQLREAGVRPEELRVVLAEACLVRPDEGWRLDNVKARPVIAPDAFGGG